MSERMRSSSYPSASMSFVLRCVYAAISSIAIECPDDLAGLGADWGFYETPSECVPPAVMVDDGGAWSYVQPTRCPRRAPSLYVYTIVDRVVRPRRGGVCGNPSAPLDTYPPSESHTDSDEAISLRLVLRLTPARKMSCTVNGLREAAA